MPASSATEAPKHFSNIRRSRPSYSCENCRSRRVKCDQVHPRCGNCVRNQVECVYSSAQPKRKNTAGGDQEAPAARKSHRQPGEETAGSPQQGYLVTQAGGRSRYIEKTFWASVDSEGLELDSLLSDLPIFPEDDDVSNEGENNAESYDILHERGPSDFWMAQNHAHNSRICPKQISLLRRLPPEQTCLKLYNIFLEGVHPLIPLIHITSFENSFQQFWDWYDTWDRQDVSSGILTENPSFLPLLLAVLFTGSLARRNTNDVENDPLDAQDCATIVLYKMALVSLNLVAFPQNPGLHSLMAYVLVNAMLIREEEALSSCSFVALSIRIAQAMGLHKDGSGFKLDPIQIEERRRLWAQLMHLDVMTACFSGLPLVASSEMYSNTRMMSELHDVYIQANIETNPENSAETSYPGYLLALARYEASTMVRKILLRQFSPDPLRLVHIRSLAEQIEVLKGHLDTRIARLRSMEQQPALRGLDSQIADSDDSPNSNFISGSVALVGWSINLLELMVEKAYCVLFQPIISNDEIWREVRSDAIPHYQNYIEIYLRMSTSEMYQPFQWLYPQSYQPLHPTAVLLIDCMKESNSPEMATSTDIIRSIFYLAGPQGRITNGSVNTEHGMSQFRPTKGAKRAWDRLEKLRSRVWNRLGLNYGDLTDAQFSSAGVEQVQSQMPLEPVNNIAPITNAELISDIPGGVTSLGSPDGLLFDELQSFSQSWFPNAFYSIQDPMSGMANSSAHPINFMVPEVTQYGWAVDASTQPNLTSNLDNANGSDAFPY